MDRLTQGEKLLGVSALWLYIISFIGFWAELEFEGGGTRSQVSVNAWDGHGLEVRLALIVALVAAGLVAARAVGFDLPVAWGLIYTGIGGLTLLLMLLTALLGPDEARSWFAALSPPSGSRIEINRGVGLFIGTVLAAAMVAGGYQHMKSEETTARSPAMSPSSSPPTTPTGA